MTTWATENPTVGHSTWAADHPTEGAHVGCTCGWTLWLEDVPAAVKGLERPVWLLDRRDEHAVLAQLKERP